MMSDLANTLERHLKELVRLNELLLGVVQQRRQALLERNTTALERLMARERDLAMAVYEQEQARQMTMVRLAGPLGKTPEEMAAAKLSDVLAWMDPATRKRLAPVAERLKRTTAEVQRVNRESVLLTQKFLPYFEELLGVLVEGSAGHASYTPGGQAARRGGVGMNVLDVTV